MTSSPLARNVKMELVRYCPSRASCRSLCSRAYEVFLHQMPPRLESLVAGSVGSSQESRDSSFACGRPRSSGLPSSTFFASVHSPTASHHQSRRRVPKNGWRCLSAAWMSTWIERLTRVKALCCQIADRRPISRARRPSKRSRHCRGEGEARQSRHELRRRCTAPTQVDSVINTH